MTPRDLKPREIETDAKSIISMQELDPSPVYDSDSFPDLESGEHIPTPEDKPARRACGFTVPKLGLRAHRWDALRMYS